MWSSWLSTQAFDKHSTFLSHCPQTRQTGVSASRDSKQPHRKPSSNKAPWSSGYDAWLACQRSRVRIPLRSLETFASQLLGALYRTKRKGEKEAGKCLTLEIGLRSIFRSLISSSKNQTNTLAAKKYWKKIFAPLISPQVEPFPHNKHPIEHGSAFLIAYSCAIGQLQWVYGLAIMSLLFMEWIKPNLKLITEHDPPMVVMGLLLCNSWFGAMESAKDI